MASFEQHGAAVGCNQNEVLRDLCASQAFTQRAQNA
jgi:hypothetical protein